MTNSELIRLIVSTIASVVIALGGLAVAYLHKKTKDIESSKEKVKAELKAERNGFRNEVYSRL
jgi:hypothetical protein